MLLLWQCHLSIWNFIRESNNSNLHKLFLNKLTPKSLMQQLLHLPILSECRSDRRKRRPLILMWRLSSPSISQVVMRKQNKQTNKQPSILQQCKQTQRLQSTECAWSWERLRPEGACGICTAHIKHSCVNFLKMTTVLQAVIILIVDVQCHTSISSFFRAK